MVIDSKLEKNIKEYCTINGLVYKTFINSLLKKAFMQEKYGSKPFDDKVELGNDIKKKKVVSSYNICISDILSRKLDTDDKNDLKTVTKTVTKEEEVKAKPLKTKKVIKFVDD